MMDTIILDIQSGLHAVLAPRKKPSPCHVNRISALDDPCIRRLYYMRHDWDKAKEIDDGLMGVFQTGNILEPVIERIVSEVGMASTPPWRIVGAQTPTHDALLKQYEISGTIDGFLQVAQDGQWATLGVCDIKTMSPNIYPRIDCYEDLAKYAWTRKYRGQLMLYSLAHNLSQCYLLLVNKTNLYDMKLVAFPVDLAYCEGLLQRAGLVNEALILEDPPEGIDDPEICPACLFYSFCAPDLTVGSDLTISEDNELEAILNRLDELKTVGSELGELERERDRRLRKGQAVACGKWLVTWKCSQRQGKDVWRKTIIRPQTMKQDAGKDSP